MMMSRNWTNVISTIPTDSLMMLMVGKMMMLMLMVGTMMMMILINRTSINVIDTTPEGFRWKSSGNRQPVPSKLLPVLGNTL